MESKTSSLIICCFLLIIILHSIPWGLAARNLVDTTQNSTLNGNNQDDSPNKGNVQGSESRHAGSATGDISPSGAVQLSPPTEVTTITYEKHVSPGHQETKKTVNRTSSEHHEYHYSTPGYQGSPFKSPPQFQENNYFTPPAYQGNPFSPPGTP